ncbi:FAD-dependent oxidoreductase [Rhizobium laguerreae]|nr:FAD-dependent oxidoreductase [Rhizobium laguerreae]MBY3418156.1 FAD-dependent oxidoreductase [Rhizobium laguerreae]NKM21116.1 FAD-dependent oxidoreductase [Rhizobium laguerreae]OOO42916.1 FAD-dependent oxidoreductase [Rhizobium laguerreae]
MRTPVTERYPLAFRLYPYVKSPDQTAVTPIRHKVVVAGGGPVGLATALDLGLRGVPVLVCDDQEGAGLGSRAICFAKRTLEICDRLGAGAAMLAKGVQWNVGKVFHDNRLLYEFNLLPENDHAFPAFVNLQQPLFEKFLHEAIVKAQSQGAPIEIRGGNRIDVVVRHEDHVTIDVMTPDGPYVLEADWLVACDGARSPIRSMLGLGFDGRVFEDNFLIADVKMKADFPTERWFWFEPHFKSGDSALLHKQPDDIWRIDFQLGWNVDRQKELQPENIRARVSAMLGPNVDYELDWCSIYKFQCRRMDKFRHGPVLFAGDSAHQVSPFGARGANSGVQDADNLGWKLALVVHGLAPDALLDTYDSERVYGADENIANSTRATDFITPKSAISKLFRDAVLQLAETVPFARTVVNSGRLSMPCTYDGSPLNGPDVASFPARTRPGSPCPDALIGADWLLHLLGGNFTLLAINADVPTTFSAYGIPLSVLSVSGRDNKALVERYLGHATRAVYLIRPDQHVAARFEHFNAKAVAAALGRALAKELVDA